MSLLVLGMLVVGAMAQGGPTWTFASKGICSLVDYRTTPSDVRNNQACQLQTLNQTNASVPDRAISFTDFIYTNTSKFASIVTRYTSVDASWSTGFLDLPAQENATFLVYTAWCKDLTTFVACADKAYAVAQADNEGRPASQLTCKTADGCVLGFSAYTKAGNQTEVRMVATSYETGIYASELNARNIWTYGYAFMSPVPTVRVTWGMAPAVLTPSSEPFPGGRSPPPPSPQPLAAAMALPWGPLQTVVVLAAMAVLQLLLLLH